MRHPIFLLTISILLLISIASISLGQAPSTQPVDLYGKIVSPDNKPVAGAEVNLVEYKSEKNAYTVSATATTDAQGLVKFADVSPNAGLAIVRASGFGLSGGALVESSADMPAEIKLKPATDLHLKFVAADGTPVSGLKVWPTYLREQNMNAFGAAQTVMIPKEPANPFASTTDASGVATFAGMPQGLLFMFDIGDDRFAATNNINNIKLAQAPSTDGGTIQLEPAGSISGRITAADMPVAQFTIMAQGQGPGPNGDSVGWSQSAQTDADGKFILKQLRSGTYSMQAQLNPKLAAQYAPPAIESFTLTSGQQIVDKNIALVAGGIVKGKATVAGTGAPIAHVSIYAYVIDNNQGRVIAQSNTTTGEDGTYLMHVAPGQQQINVNDPAPPGYLMPRTSSRSMTITDGQSVSVDFELPVNPNPALKGHVVDSTGAPVAGASIVLENAADRQNFSPYGSQVRTDKDGAFNIPGVADSSAVRARKGAMSTVAAVFVTGQNRNDMTITLQKDAMASARIKVVDGAGKPVPDAQVMVLQSMGNMRFSTNSGTTDAGGIDLVSSLYPDTTYSLQARAKGYGNGTANLTLKPGATIDVSVSMLKADSFVAGMLLDENQLPLADTTVYASGSRANGQAKSDFTGHFRIDGLVAGETLTVYTRAGNRIAQQPTERFPASTDNIILIHNATPPAPASRPAAGIR